MSCEHCNCPCVGCSDCGVESETDRRHVPLEERLSSKIAQDPDTQCWEWQGSVSAQGYGILNLRGRMRLSHRLIYELVVGPIPSGLVIDHLCSNKLCQNPSHLETVTSAENTRRGSNRYWAGRSTALLPS